MPLSNSTSTSITDIEEQIAKITAELEKARASHYIAAEKTLVAAQKRTAIAQARVNDLNAKGSTTVAAQSRLALAKAALTEQETLLADAESIFNAAKAEQDAADEFAKNVALLLSGKKLGKKIKFSKKEKAVLKEDKKAAKKIAKQEKKTAKQQAKDEKKNQKKAAKVQTEIAPNAVEKTVPKKVSAPKTLEKKPAELKPAAAKKAASTSRAPVKKAASVTEKAVPIVDPSPETDLLDAPTPTNPLPPAIAAETPATEAGHDAVVESETLPESEKSTTEDDSQKPVND